MCVARYVANSDSTRPFNTDETLNLALNREGRTHMSLVDVEERLDSFLSPDDVGHTSRFQNIKYSLNWEPYASHPTKELFARE